MGNEGAVQQWKTLYKSFWPFPETWHADNYTDDLRGYYGYRYTQTADAEFLIEFGDLQSERQALSDEATPEMAGCASCPLS